MPKGGPPDVDGLRYCNACAGYCPIDAFPRGKNRRYLCRAHAAERYGQAYRARLRASMAPEAFAALTSAYNRLLYDCKHAFGGGGLSLRELRGLVAQAGQSVVPRDPQRPVGPDNAAVLCRPQARALLVQLWRATHDPGLYTQLLSSLAA